MIDYQTYCQIRQFYTEKKLSFRQIARELKPLENDPKVGPA
jgi:hypothetical protein